MYRKKSPKSQDVRNQRKLQTPKQFLKNLAKDAMPPPKFQSPPTRPSKRVYQKITIDELRMSLTPQQTQALEKFERTIYNARVCQTPQCKTYYVNVNPVDGGFNSEKHHRPFLSINKHRIYRKNKQSSSRGMDGFCIIWTDSAKGFSSPDFGFDDEEQIEKGLEHSQSVVNLVFNSNSSPKQNDVPEKVVRVLGMEDVTFEE